MEKKNLDALVVLLNFWRYRFYGVPSLIEDCDEAGVFDMADPIYNQSNTISQKDGRMKHRMGQFMNPPDVGHALRDRQHVVGAVLKVGFHGVVVVSVDPHDGKFYLLRFL